MTEQTPAPPSAFDKAIRHILQYRVRFAPLRDPENIQRERINVQTGTDIDEMYAEAGYRVIDAEIVTA